MTLDLFPEYEDTASGPPAPLAERMRPESWDDFAGHESLVGPKGPLRLLFARDSTLSFILWGPPGSGKTTIARICAKVTNSEFYEISAVQSGIAELRKVVAAAKLNWKSRQRRTLLFIDEIHRFNKVQQDAILPFVEDGTLSLIGSTPENPSFEVIPALLSRCQVFRMETLSPDTLRSLVARALLDKERGLGETPVELQEESMTLLIRYANGDARRALNGLEAAVRAHLQDADPTQPLAPATMAAVLQHAAVLYDKGGNEHYDHASAFQKSLRGSDPDAAIYWLAKMIAGGEDPEFIARRLVVTAAEDVGNAD
ncbi:MAG: replication-associated recombination protein A, partial [Nitrospinaceae bacterium]